MNVQQIICTTHGRQISRLNFQVKDSLKAWTIYGLVRLVTEYREQYSIEYRKLDTSAYFLFPFPSKHFVKAIEFYFFTPESFSCFEV